MQELQEAISSWLRTSLTDNSFQKLEEAFQKLSGEAEDWEVFSSFSAVPRYTGKEKLQLTDVDITDADRLKPGWQPQFWTTDQIGRTWLLLAISERGKEEFLDKLDKLFKSADLREAVALYQSLPVLPWPEELKLRAAEGIRTNIISVFNAVAHRNPYPSEYLDDDAWNQLILKSLFVGTPLYLIHGLDERANQDLAHMLVEYAHERWSAGRDVSPELWRPVGPFFDEDYKKEIQKVLSHSDKNQRFAGVLALMSADSSEAGNLLQKNIKIVEEVKDKHIAWDDIGRHAEETN